MARHGSHSNEDKPSRQTIDGQTTGSQTKTGNPAAANPPSVTRNKNSDPFRDAVEQGIKTASNASTNTRSTSSHIPSPRSSQ